MFKAVRTNFKKQVQLPAAQSAESHTILLNGRPVEYTAVRSARARRVSITVSEKSGLRVTMPIKGSHARAETFLREKEKWVFKQLHSLRNKEKKKQEQLREGGALHLFGVPHTVRMLTTTKKKPHIKLARALRYHSDHAEYTGYELLIYAPSAQAPRAHGASAEAKEDWVSWAPNRMSPEPIKKEVTTVLQKFLRQKADTYFKQRVPQLAEHMNLTFNRVTTKTQHTRWGSCSREKNINLNWRLIFFPLAVTDYVIMHELVHTKHLNHGVRFYALLEKHCPNYQQLRKQLREGVSPV